MAMSENGLPYDSAKGRRFALTLAAAFAVLATISWWRGREWVPVALGALAAVLGAAAIVAPSRLGSIERGWMALARALSKVTTPIFMGIVYFVVLTPVGFFRRAFGSNPLVHKPDDGSYWIARPPMAPTDRRRRMERQF
ncbi:MAG: SxtJ family membrane protein [Gemmatimonadaceae bacterium]|nr:SxtJ family membrane protein [Gemmatimonadaceae bacterium]